MPLYGRAENNQIVEISNFESNPEAPGMQWFLIPDVLVPYANRVMLKVESGVVDLLVPSSLDDILFNSVKSVRKSKQENGIISYEDNQYPTDMDSINIITSTVVLASIQEKALGEGTYSVMWKSETGFVELNLQDLVNIGALCANYVNSCFVKEATLKQKIASVNNVDEKIRLTNNAESYFQSGNLEDTETDNVSTENSNTSNTAKVANTSSSTDNKNKVKHHSKSK